MIESFLCQTCTLLQRQSGSRSSHNEYTYSTKSDVECLGLRVNEQNAKNDVSVNNVNYIRLYLKEKVRAYDKVVFDDYVYMIKQESIGKQKNILTGEVEYYTINLMEAEEYPVEAVSIQRRT